MEKRALLAALLSGVVLVLWYAFFMPAKPKGPAEVPSLESPVTAAETAAVASQPEGAAEAPGVSVTGPPAEQGEAEEELVLAGQGWRGVVSTRGGIVRSMVLDEYQDEAGEPLDLVGPAGLLAMAGDGPWNDEIYVAEREGDGLRLRWSDGRGNWVEKTIAPGPGRYGLEIQVSSGGEPERLGVRVAAGVGKDVEESSRGRLAVAGGVVRVDGKLERIKAEKIEGQDELRGRVEFAGAENQYFLVVLLPEGDVSEVRVTAVQEGSEAVANVAVVGRSGTIQGTLFAGPKEHRTLVAYGRGLEETLSFGIFGFFSVVFLSVLQWIHSWTGNWGVAIILLTAALRVVLFPLTHKSTVAMRKMQAVQPKMKAIQERYKERAKKDPQVRARMNQEIMGLYKQEGVNPMGGCLPTLVQLPILWALYTLFANAIELRHAPFALWITDLSLKDPTYVTPILMTVSMVVQQRLAPQTGDPAQRRMFMLMPFVFGLMFMSFPAGLVLYWLVNNVLTIGQQVLTERLMDSGTGKV